MPVEAPVSHNLEHNTLRLAPDMHPGVGGVFAIPQEGRFQTKETIGWLVQSFGYVSLHELRRAIDKMEGSQNFIPPSVEERAEAVSKKWVESHGLEYTKQTMEDAFATAEAVISEFTEGIFPHVLHIKELNEIASERNPLKLLGYALNHADPRIKFEAVRKLYSADMSLGATKVRKDSQPHIEYFFNVLSDHMFTNPKKDKKLATPTALEFIHFMSYHVEDDYRSVFLREFKPGEKIDESMLQPNMRIHTLPMRTWYDMQGNPHRVFIEPRIKPLKAFIIKELRNQTLNPLMLEDNLGAKMTFNTTEEADLFLATLLSKPIPISPLLSGINYTINNGKIQKKHFVGRHAASSNYFEIVKYTVTINGVLYEMQVNTVRTWIDTILRDGVCWDDYAINRVIKPDHEDWLPVTELLFPQRVFGINLVDLAEPIIKSNQMTRRSLPPIIPPELRRKDRITRMMTASEFRSKIEALGALILEAEANKQNGPRDNKRRKNEMKEIVENMFIVVAEEDSSKLDSAARLLGRRLGLSPGHVLPLAEIRKIPSDGKIVIFDDVFVQAKHINRATTALSRLGHARKNIQVAVLIADTSVQNKKGLFFAEALDTRITRIVFPFENETRMYNSSCIFLCTQDNGQKILVEVLPDRKFKLPGGSKENGERPKTTIQREILEELGLSIRLRSIKPALRGPYWTLFEPHDDLTKIYSQYLMHYVFRIPVPAQPWKLPKNFQFVDVQLVGANLRWKGQRDLWHELIRKGAIKV